MRVFDYRSGIRQNSVPRLTEFWRIPLHQDEWRSPAGSGLFRQTGMVCLSHIKPTVSPQSREGQMSVQLSLVSGPTRIGSVHVRKRETLVGRQKGCDIRIPSDDISRRHCLLMFDRGTLTIEDLNSANGTFVNGDRITGRRRVKPGDEIKIGPLTFRIDDPQPQTPVPTHKDSSQPRSPVPTREDESDEDSGSVYTFVGEKRQGRKREVEIELDSHALDHLPKGEDLRDLLRGMDR